MPKVLVPGEIGPQFEPRLTVDGLRNLLQDRRTAKQPMPACIVVSEYDFREINQDLLAGSAEPVAKEDQRPEHDGQCIPIIEGIQVRWNRDVPRGKARLLFTASLRETANKLGGEGLVIVGA